MNTKKIDIRDMTMIGVLSGISVVLGMTPLGFIPIGPAKATTMHIPVIIGGIVGGPFVGAMVGLIFGIFSIMQAMSNPTPLSFAFINPLVSVLPRVLIGFVSAYSYKYIKISNNKLKASISAVLGSLTNTFGVLGMMYIIFTNRLATAMNITGDSVGKFILGIGFINGIPEAILAVMIVVGVLNGISLGKGD